MTLETARLRLLPHEPAHLLALCDGPAAYERASGLRVADGMHEFLGSPEISPAYFALLRVSTAPDPWRIGFAVVLCDAGLVIGSAGFKGPPDANGVVEIAYGIVPAYAGQGYATETAPALVAFAFADGRVRRVRAHTLPRPNASTRVLTKCGFTRIGEFVDPDDGPVWRWERSNSALSENSAIVS